MSPIVNIFLQNSETFRRILPCEQLKTITNARGVPLATDAIGRSFSSPLELEYKGILKS
ncbi:MAG: hypothetical protein ACFFAU_03665 [Candidatus Hodarchaeota archaeon]